jgi:hypothetical protein
MLAWISVLQKFKQKHSSEMLQKRPTFHMHPTILESRCHSESQTWPLAVNSEGHISGVGPARRDSRFKFNSEAPTLFSIFFSRGSNCADETRQTAKRHGALALADQHDQTAADPCDRDRDGETAGRPRSRLQKLDITINSVRLWGLTAEY